jgi:hypothetical protein
MRSASTGPVADDFSEALSIIEEKYVDGNKLDYNTVYKSSIMGMPNLDHTRAISTAKSLTS